MVKAKHEYVVGIIGCGKILVRHLESIESKNNFLLKSVCDINQYALDGLSLPPNVNRYTDYKEMIAKEPINFVVVATPNSLHTEQAIYCLQNGCDVLVEKPASLNPADIPKVLEVAEKNYKNVYGVLQVRLNDTIQNVKKILDNKVLGELRGVSLVQRWQRPESYFHDWRAEPLVGGGLLHECGIHYLDILCYLFGKPSVHSAKHYNTKHKGVEVEDTIYSILDFDGFGGTAEVTIASEPSNIECSISILAENGYIKVGGKALNKLEVCLVNEGVEIPLHLFNEAQLDPNNYGKYEGSCPNHPQLYSQLENFELGQTQDVISLIDEIYLKSGLKYY